jgi:hypothetical protein
MTVVVQLSVGWVITHQSAAMGYHPSYLRSERKSAESQP